MSEHGRYQAIIETAQNAVKPEILKVGNDLFTTKPVYRVPKEFEPAMPRAIKLATLSALVRYVEDVAVPASLPIEALHVVSSTRVELIGKLTGQDMHLRPVFCYAEAPPAPSFPFDRWLDFEEFKIKLLAHFKPNDELARLDGFLKSVKREGSLEVEDDGISQSVQVKKGISLTSREKLTNPFGLAPWRVFPEVEQPVSPFILRFQRDAESPQPGLYVVADNGWQGNAIASIRDYLSSELGAENSLPILA